MTPSPAPTFLLPGEMVHCSDGRKVGTILGSCVSVCVYHPTSGRAGMNHFLLPGSAMPNAERGRYGHTAMEDLLSPLLKLDAAPEHYEVSVFGGGDVTGAIHESIGARNVEVATEWLATRGFTPTRRDVRGVRGRKVQFNTANGSIDVNIAGESEEGRRLREQREALGKKVLEVLLVDDSPLVRNIVRKALEPLKDLQVVGEAGDPYEARSLLVERRPDVILLDIVMPKMDGLAFLEKLNQHLPIPVVILSTIAKDSSRVAERAKELGATAVIDKDSLEIYKSLDNATKILGEALRLAPMRFNGGKK